MVTTEQQKLASKRLTQWIENDKRIVTFRELSREVGCHVNTAKNLLLRYYNANPSTAPIYLLAGPLKSNSHLAETTLEPSAPASPTATQSLAHLATQGVRIVDMDEMSDADRNSEPEVLDDMGMENEEGFLPGNDQGEKDGLSGGRNLRVKQEDEEIEHEEVARWGVVLVQAEKLEEKRELFEASSLSIHIYALSPGPVNDPAQYLVPSLTVREHKAYHNPSVYGTITGDAFKPNTGGGLKDGAMDWSSSSKKEEKGVKENVKKGKEEVKKVEVAKAASGLTTKEQVKLGAITKEDEGEKMQDKASTKKATDPKSKANTKTTAMPAKSTIPKKRASTANDDETERSESPAPVAGSSKVLKEPTSSMNREDDNAAMEAMMDMDFEMDSEDDEEVTRKAKAKKGNVGTAEVIKVKTEPGERKRRKVRKSVMEQNEKGYMVSKDVWEEESYSGDSEPEPAPAVTASKTSKAAKKDEESAKKAEPPKAQAKPAPKPAAGGKKGGQSTLAGFFKKK